MRKNIVAGNWKMNCTLDESKKLASEVINMVEMEVKSNTDVILIPPFAYLTTLGSLIGSSEKIHLGAQNCHQREQGAFTGEVAAPMLKSCGASHIIVGHSERREYFQESDELLAKKIELVLKHDMTPIFCCGEKLASREANEQEKVVLGQIEKALFGLPEEDIKKVMIAYEPVWAIGTGKTATAEQAQGIHAFMRIKIAERYSLETARAVSILYGGSMKPENARELFLKQDVDGGLIGGASLKSRDFTDIVKAMD